MSRVKKTCMEFNVLIDDLIPRWNISISRLFINHQDNFKMVIEIWKYSVQRITLRYIAISRDASDNAVDEMKVMNSDVIIRDIFVESLFNTIVAAFT